MKNLLFIHLQFTIGRLKDRYHEEFTIYSFTIYNWSV